MNTHSPLPWSFKRIKSSTFDITDSSGSYVSISATESDAQFIVTACNSHRALVEALEECITDDNAYVMITGNKETMHRRIFEINRIARAALALAKGGK